MDLSLPPSLSLVRPKKVFQGVTVIKKYKVYILYKEKGETSITSGMADNMEIHESSRVELWNCSKPKRTILEGKEEWDF